MRPAECFDLVAIGGGPAGRGAAVQAARLGKRAAVVDHGVAAGEAGMTLGCASSKVLRAANLELAGRAMGVYGKALRTAHGLDLEDLVWKAPRILAQEHEAELVHLRRAGVHVIAGRAAFLDPHRLEIRTSEAAHEVRAEQIVIAVGTAPQRPTEVDFDDSTVLDSDAILRLERLPRTLTVVGASVSGLEYASLAAALGVGVTLVERSNHVLRLLDRDIVEALQYHLRGLGVSLRVGDAALSVRRRTDGSVATRLAGGEELVSDAAVYAAGRLGATANLRLAAAGLKADSHGRIAVDGGWRTAQPHILAAGAVTGRTGLTTTSAHDGRVCALAAFGQPKPPETLVAHGIHTIPEIACVGMTERELVERGIPYVAGTARYRDLPRADIAGDRAGMLKLLVRAGTRRVAGVHAFGTSSTELIHLGQALIAGNLSAEYLLDASFQAPTFTIAYSFAARDALGRLPR